MRILVTGAGGFIGHHLVTRLKAEGHYVIGVDIKRPEWETSPADVFGIHDLRTPLGEGRVGDVDQVYALAADMGGIGFISENHADVAWNNIRITGNTLDYARAAGARLLYTSSACVYPAALQRFAATGKLRESYAVPADPERGYGWEKLFGEQLCTYYREDYGVETRIARLHNVYGPMGTYDGGREKAPAALCRKVALAAEGGTVELWGDGLQTRSFCYVDDAVEGLVRLMAAAWHDPLNIGSEELVTVAELARLVQSAARKVVAIRWDPSKPQGVRGRNSDNTLCRKVLGWEPSTRLEAGLAQTYPWIERQVRRGHP